MLPMFYKVIVVFTKDKHGYFASCPTLPGCHSQDDNFDEAKANIKEAIDLYLETMNEEEISAVLL